MKNWLINCILILFLFVIVFFTNWIVRDKMVELSYDFQNENKAVNSVKEIEQVLRGLKTISYAELPNDYLT